MPSNFYGCFKHEVHRNGTIFQKSFQLLAYADDVDIIGHTKRYVTAAFSAVERQSTKMGLAVSEGKTKPTYYLLHYGDFNKLSLKNKKKKGKKKEERDIICPHLLMFALNLPTITSSLT